MPKDIAVWVADVGSVPGRKLGWCGGIREDRCKSAGTDIDEFANGIVHDLSAGMAVALGFECPLFVPLPGNPQDLGKARSFERNRPWSAGAGSSALSTGLVQCVWIFEKIRAQSTVPVLPTFSWETFTHSSANLFIWEAMVTGISKGNTHLADAEIAAERFWQRYPNLGEPGANHAIPSYSLVAAGLLRAGLSSDLGLLFHPCVVVVA